MTRYLDPKNDLVFKRVFGEHPAILRSLLNALLPLPVDGQIVSLEYLPTEQVPLLPLLKRTIVDVRCKDQSGRQFIVEMQMNWTAAFMQRVLFTTSKAYVKQLEKGEQYELLQPVMGLSLLDDVFDSSPEFYHHYKIVNVAAPERTIEGLQLVFVELPKFRASGDNTTLKEAWLRFLRETGASDEPEHLRRLKDELASQSPDIEAALSLSGEAAFSRAELEAYDRYWDVIRSERTLISGKYNDGLRAGREEGRREGREEGREEGRKAAHAAILAKLVAGGLSPADATKLVGDS
jgi:predicted transposase/invertase (TIGR01784 family)